MHPINVRQSNISLVGNDCKDFTQLPLRCTSQPGNRQQAHHCSKGVNTTQTESFFIRAL